MESRFEFGRNWALFLEGLDEGRVARARESLQQMLGAKSLAGIRFLDIGSGSGLFSLAAKSLGARVRSFDYDPDSVACTDQLKKRYFNGDPDWTVEQGSALDQAYLETLGKFDVVYSWGVLHHTGNMQQALENAGTLVADQGKLFIAIYNDQGWKTSLWKKIKGTYNALPRFLRFLILGPCFLRLWGPSLAKDFLLLRPFRTWTAYRKNRGMSPWRDFVDWVGGYPFEAAKPEEIFRFFRQRGFTLLELKTCGGGIGCNEYVFQKMR